MIGRCADFVLKDDPDMISVYVHADHDFQMKSALERVSMSEKEMEEIHRTNQQIPFRLLSLSHRKKLG